MTDKNLTKISNLKNNTGRQITLGGWVYQSRCSGKILFIVLRDGTGICQCVGEKTKIPDELFEKLRHLPHESSVYITGSAKEEQRSPGGYELSITDAEIIHSADEYPITPKSHGIDFLLKNRHLHLRSQSQWCILRIRHTLINSVRDFFNKNDFTLIDTPIFTCAAGEQADSLFEVDYFGEPIHLTQTGQLHLESAVMSLGRVYCFGPTFRAEKSKTRRHLTEFWMVEPEVAFTKINELMTLAENFISSIISEVLERNKSELEILGCNIKALEKIKPPFPKLTYTEVSEILKSDKTQKFLSERLESFKRQRDDMYKRIEQLQAEQAGSIKKYKREKNAAELIELRTKLSEIELKIKNNPKHAKLAAQFEWGKDLGGSDETIISQMHEKPVFVTHYPQKAKAFYMKADRDNPKVVENFDMLAPAGFGEIIGGSMREHDYDILIDKIRQNNLNPEDYQWYLDLRRYGSVPHGGFGLGIERTIAWITGEKHIRQCIPFPRMMDKVYI
jgi:asparaginyl-tRNA synthetase